MAERTTFDTDFGKTGVLTDASGAGLVMIFGNYQWFRIGQLLIVGFTYQYPVTVDGSDNKIGGLLPMDILHGGNIARGFITAHDVAGSIPQLFFASETEIQLTKQFSGAWYTNAELSGLYFEGFLIYEI